MNLNGTETDFVRENVIEKGKIPIRDAVLFILLSRFAEDVVLGVNPDKISPSNFAERAKEITQDIQTLMARA